MTDHVTSADGTRIAHDRLGDGPPLIVVGGMFCDRGTTGALATALAGRFTVINYDRRGRGESGDTLPYAPEREVEDIAALMAAVGGRASLHGVSSGAALALLAASAGLPVDRLVLHEPPYGADDDESRARARALADGVRTAIANDRRADAIKLFMTATGMPEQMAAGISADPGMQAIAPTMPYDYAVMGEGGVIPRDAARSVTVPTLVLAGGASAPFFRDTAARLGEIMPDARVQILDGVGHDAPADALTEPITAFLTS
ncbi:alpha/beta fold hydrolase [Actinomadura algeriensis]|uniref:Pimeloyl-ACP methyl ester carboxylesterase n=1 Tax=Actinomadura algeriensis TaxID=1679523 RepID=A0ABR9JSJ7_9ACTN|nr:alpha/beta hydrolase [Actinomadura algeriensis]MBE1533541.1 pimeloyl-ACP methyl ester carboxylesterase [Actinomadura algeriensis]